MPTYEMKSPFSDSDKSWCKFYTIAPKINHKITLKRKGETRILSIRLTPKLYPLGLYLTCFLSLS